MTTISNSSTKIRLSMELSKTLAFTIPRPILTRLTRNFFGLELRYDPIIPSHIKYIIIIYAYFQQISDQDIIDENGPWNVENYETDKSLDIMTKAVVMTSEMKLRIVLCSVICHKNRKHSRHTLKN